MAIKKPNMEDVKAFQYQLKTNVKFGIGEFQNLGYYLKELNYCRIGIVVDSNVYKAPYVKSVLDNLYKYIGVGEEKYQKIKILQYKYGEPTYDLLETHRARFIDCDCIVGIGGGSVIDFAKGLALLSTNFGPALLYRGFPTNLLKPLPVIAIPTTAGTGSEVTYNAVFVDENKKKLGINTTLNFPILAILDPKLIQLCPKDVMISSGMDALTHAIESYGATKSNALTRMFSDKALQLLMTNLVGVTNKTDIEVCYDLQLAAYLSGIALMNSGSGPAGALSYVLGPQFFIPHGLAGAIFLPHIVKHNEKKGFSYPIKNLSTGIFTICEMLGIDNYDLRKYNVVKASDLRVLSAGIETLQPAFDQNPVKFTVENAKDIVRSMI